VFFSDADMRKDRLDPSWFTLQQWPERLGSLRHLPADYLLVCKYIT